MTKFDFGASIVIIAVGTVAIIGLAIGSVAQVREDCEFYYERANYYYSGVPLPTNLQIGHAYATMYLACRERNR